MYAENRYPSPYMPLTLGESAVSTWSSLEQFKYILEHWEYLKEMHKVYGFITVNPWTSHKDSFQIYFLEKTFSMTTLACPRPIFSHTQQQWLRLDSQKGFTHGARIAMHFPIWAFNGVVLPGARESSVSHIVTVFTAQLLPNEGGFKNQVIKYWITPPQHPSENCDGMLPNVVDALKWWCRRSILPRYFSGTQVTHYLQSKIMLLISLENLQFNSNIIQG